MSELLSQGIRRAVLIGVNECPQEPAVGTLRFAESDALEVSRVLTHNTTGAFGASDVQVIVNQGATTEAIKEALCEAALATDDEDVLLVYFSGHGFIPAHSLTGEVYLATYDLQGAALRRDPDRGIRTGFLQRDVFGMVRGSSILILDCCHAGSYDPDHDRPSLVPRLYDSNPRSVRRHSAFLACPADAATRESDELRHGVFTHHLLQGLQGRATGSHGRVTLDSLAGYLNGVQIDPPFGHSLQAFGKAIVLTRPDLEHKASAGTVEPREPLRRPMENAEAQLSQLLTRLFPRRDLAVLQPGFEEVERLEVVRSALEADGVAVAVREQAGMRCHLAADQTAERTLPETVRKIPVGSLASESVGQLFRQASDRDLMVLPIGDRRYLVVDSPSTAIVQAGAPISTVLRRFYASGDSNIADPTMVEIDILKDLLDEFGPLPPTLADKLFQLYRKKISSLVMVFEPVVQLSHDPGIASYEALARLNSEARSAPGRLLDLADALGPTFLSARDRILAKKAIHGYAEAHRTGPWRNDMAKPLSVNVSVSAITSSDYIADLRECLKDAHWQADHTTLEISEKDPISHGDFKDQISKLAASLGIRFAVDDFGVGYASLDRLATLPITQIKIDSAVLRHPLALQELRLVVKVANHSFFKGKSAAPRPIVVEGVDEDCPITLKQLHKAKINFIQGYIVGKPATQELYVLPDETRTLIRESLGG